MAGAGYVGLSNSMLLAQNHEVIVFDINSSKIDKLNKNILPIVDSDIENFISNKDLNFVATSSKELAYQGADFVIIATPTNYDELTNQFYTKTVEKVIANILDETSSSLIIIKSTVQVGFT